MAVVEVSQVQRLNGLVFGSSFGGIKDTGFRVWSVGRTKWMQGLGFWLQCWRYKGCRMWDFGSSVGGIIDAGLAFLEVEMDPVVLKV